LSGTIGNELFFGCLTEGSAKTIANECSVVVLVLPRRRRRHRRRRSVSVGVGGIVKIAAYRATSLRLRWECHIQNILEKLTNLAHILSKSDAI
jgi:hypothetical protein